MHMFEESKESTWTPGYNTIVFLHAYQQDHVQMTANPTGFVLVSVQPTVVAHLARSRKQEDVV